MSQSRIKSRGLPENTDWMQELAQDAANWQAVVQNVDNLASLVLGDLTLRRDYKSAALRVAMIREGLGILCKLAGVELKQDVTAA
jgi:hypothetical protein